MTFDEVVDADTETKSYEEETKTVTTNFNEKKQPVKHKIYLIKYKSKLFAFIIVSRQNNKLINVL